MPKPKPKPRRKKQKKRKKKGSRPKSNRATLLRLKRQVRDIDDFLFAFINDLESAMYPLDAVREKVVIAVSRAKFIVEALREQTEILNAILRK